MSQQQVDVAFCNFCEDDKKITVWYQHIVPREESFEYGLVNDVYELVQCQTCKSFFIKNIRDDTDLDGSTRYVCTIPQQHIALDKFKGKFTRPSGFQSAPDDQYHVFSMHRQILSAINSRDFWLAHAGMRCLIEEVCQQKFGCKMGNFKEMEKAIAGAALLSDPLKEITQRILDSSQSSVHRGYSPDENEIMECLGGIELFLEQVHIHPAKATSISNAALPGKSGKIQMGSACIPATARKARK